MSEKMGEDHGSAFYARRSSGALEVIYKVAVPLVGRVAVL